MQHLTGDTLDCNTCHVLQPEHYRILAEESGISDDIIRRRGK